MTRRALIRGSLAIGLAGTIALAIGFVVAPGPAAFAFVTAWTYAVSIALGGLILLLVGHATKATWMIVFRRFAEAIVASLPALALGIVPLALVLGRVYPWVHPSAALAPEARALIAHKAPYLNPTFFVVRAAIFFVVWIVIGELATRWTARPPSDAAAQATRLRMFACAVLPAVAFTLTFAAFDWLMSMTPTWYSSVFGLLYFAGGFVAALGTVAVIARGARRVPAVRASIHASHTGALGRLVFAFLCFWAYMEFSQGVIIWIANKPGEVPWYVTRGAGAWGSVFGILVGGHFALPFFALLSRALKRRPTLLAVVGAWLLVMHYVDIYWMVMPVLHPTVAVHWLDIAAPLSVLGLATAAAAARTSDPLPLADPRWPTAVAYEGS